MQAPQVTIIDYGVGNLLSVKRGFEHCGAEVILTSNPKQIRNSDRVVLPGVGAFPNAMRSLDGLGLIPVIQELDKLNTPLLAICLGMQLLMEESDEFGLSAGLGLIPGRVVKVPVKTTTGHIQKIPHIGWSSLYPSGRAENWNGSLLENHKLGDACYFVHSFMAQPSDEANRVADAIYGGHRIAALISKNKITGCQFHPEKSGEVGLKILRNFIRQ